MATRVKLKIMDAEELRRELDELYEQVSQADLAKWSLRLAAHILEKAGIGYEASPVLLEGFRTNELWQAGLARTHEVRQAGFRIHALARTAGDPVTRCALRTAGQAVGSGHMREHAMVASDYAIKVVNLLAPGDGEAASAERQWQILEMKKHYGSSAERICETDIRQEVSTNCRQGL